MHRCQQLRRSEHRQAEESRERRLAFIRCARSQGGLQGLHLHRCGEGRRPADFTSNFFPTKIKIEQFLDNARQYIKPEDLVVFAFSGHGVNDANANGYLLPLDCRLANLYATAVSEATITAWLKKLGVTRSLVLLDACRSELRSDRSIAGRDILYSPKFENAKVSAVFYSSEKGAVSYEDPTSDYGTFTRFVVQGLHAAADKDGDGLVTFRELQTHVEDAMIEWALGTGHSQRPYIRLLDEQSGDLALAIVSLGAVRRQDEPGGSPETGRNGVNNRWY